MNLDRVIAVRNNKTVYRDGDRCIKTFNGEYSKTDVLSEALCQARVEQIGLNVPKILEVTMIDGRWAIVSEYVRGKTLAQLMEQNPERKEAYIDLLTELQLSVHQKTAPVPERLADKLRRRLSQLRADETTRKALKRHIEAMPECSTLCHGDFNPSNIILTESEVPYILDWSQATLGDAAVDAACTYLYFRFGGEAAEAERYLDSFCRKSHVARQDVQKWIPVVAGLRLVRGDPSECERFLKSIGEEER